MRRRAERCRPERFLRAAAERSCRFGHDYIGTEHVLLALAEEPGGRARRALAHLGVDPELVRRGIERVVGTCIGAESRHIDADALAELGIDLDEVTRRVEETFGPGALDIAPAASRPHRIAPRLRTALDLALRDAGDGPLRSEHVLLSLAAVERSVAARILDEHGIRRGEIMRALDAAP